MRRHLGCLLVLCLAAVAQDLPQAKEVLGKVAKAYRSAKSYRVEAVVTNQVGTAPARTTPGPRSEVIDVAFQAPSLVRIERGTTTRTVTVLGAPRDQGQFHPDFGPPRNTAEQDSYPAPTASSLPDPADPAKRQRVQWMKNAGFEDYSAIEDGLIRAETVRQENVDFEGSPVACWVVEGSYTGDIRRTLWIDSARNVVLREIEIGPGVTPAGTPRPIVEHTIAVQHLSWNVPLGDLFSNPAPVDSALPSMAPRPGPNGITPVVELNGCHDAGYTEEAHIAHLTGTIMLDYTIDLQGKPVNIKELNHLGLGLDDLAIGCVEELRFRPAEKDGHGITVHAKRSVPFQIREPVTSEWHLAEAIFHPQTGEQRPVFLKAPYPQSAGAMDLRPLGVRVNLTIDAQGVPRDIQVEGDATSKWAKQAASLVTKWRFTPGLRDGQPAAMPATFVLAHGTY